MDVVKESIVKAAGFTLIVLILGMLVGLQMDDFRQNHLEQELRQSSLETETFVSLQNYIDDTSENYCDLMKIRVPEISEKSSDFGSQLNQLEAQSIVDDSEYEFIRNRYYNNQLTLYSTTQEYRERCNGVNQTNILFFFDDSTDSIRQGEVLDGIVKDYNVSVFSFNSELNEEHDVADSPVVKVLKADYNVTESPTLVINGEEKIEGYISKGELEYEVLQ